MKSNKLSKMIFIILMVLLCLHLAKPAFAQYRKAILVVGNHSDQNMTRKENALKNYLVHYRQKSGYNSSSLPIFIYDFNNPQVKKYCEKVLGIRESDTLFLGIVTAKGTLPEKVHLKVVDPQNLEKNARLVIEKFTKAPASGALSITSTPSGAKVWLEKKYKGKTPLTIRKISEGDYTITLVKTGYAKTRKTLYVGKDKTTYMSVDMPSSLGSLALKSEPSGAKVYINGVYYGDTPLEVGKIKPGTHRIQMKKDSASWSGSVKVSSGQTLELSEKLTGSVAMETPKPTPMETSTPTPIPTYTKTPDTDYTPPEIPTSTPGAGVTEAFIPRSETNAVFQVTVSNIENVSSIKDYYKPKPGYKFVVVYLQQQNISNEVQIYTGKFSLVDQKNSSYEALDKLSNFWLVVLRPGGIIMGYLVYEIPEDSKPMGIVLHGLNMAPLSVQLK